MAVIVGQLSGRPYPVLEAVLWQGAAWGIWGVWSQVILSLVDRVPLRMQLNPHVLFNALISVAELMEMDVREAQRTLTRVSDLLRLSLRSAASPTIPLWQEIELVELYLQIARIRFGDKLAVDIVVDPAAVDLEGPSFVLQPLVENALKHGIGRLPR